MKIRSALIVESTSDCFQGHCERNWMTELSLQWYYKNWWLAMWQCVDSLSSASTTFLCSSKNIAPPAKVMAPQEAFERKKNKRGRNMNESNISLIAQLRECEDADNGPVLIKLFFPPCVVFLLQAIFLKMQFSFNSHIKCSCRLSFSRLCSFSMHQTWLNILWLIFDLEQNH